VKHPVVKPNGTAAEPWPTRVVSLAELGQAGRLAKPSEIRLRESTVPV